MKELTGGDKIQCRCLFKEPIKFKPMFKMILTCNHMPAIPPDDGGTWRRIRRVEFTSKFVDSPNKDENSNEFKIDRELSHKFTLWKETFMIMLLHKYKKYKKLGKIVEPKEVLDYTSEYQRKNDIFADFCDTYIKNEPGGVVPVATLFAIFKEYCTVDNIKNKGIKKAIFQEALEKRYGFVINMGGSKGKCWKGIEIVPQKTINNNLEEIDEDDKC
jgi:phage/plasmid-associated DNA primase